MLGSIFGAILTYESWPIPRLECLLPGHFAKKSSDFKEINPRSNLLSQNILQKNPQFFSKSTRSPTSSLSSLCKKDPEFFRNTTGHPSLLGLACHSLRGPQWAKFGPKLVCLIYYSFTIINKFAQTLKLRSKS